MRPKLLNESMVHIIRKRRKLKTKYTTITQSYDKGNFYGVLIICISVICFYLRYTIYKLN